MLLKVQHEKTKKYVKLEEVSFSDFISAVLQKFLLPEDKVLKVTDERGIEVDEEVFPELATESMCFVISTDDVIPLAESSKNIADGSDPTAIADCSNVTELVTLDFTLLQQDGEQSPSLSLTDFVVHRKQCSGVNSHF